MKDNAMGGFVIVLIISIIALGCGIVCGVNHIGADISKEIIPISLTESAHIINVIDEGQFIADNISIKSTYTKNTSSQNITNDTNNTKNNTDNNTEKNNTKNETKNGTKNNTTNSLSLLLKKIEFNFYQ